MLNVTLLCAVFAAPAMGRVIVVSGTVQVERDSGDPAALAVGAVLSQGDIVVTGAESRARIYLDNRSVLDIAPESRLQLTELRPSQAGSAARVRLWLGRLWARVAAAPAGSSGERLEIETENAVAGVRGTSFFIERASAEETAVTVEAGAVDIGVGDGPRTLLRQAERGSLGRSGLRVERGVSEGELGRLRAGVGAQGKLRRGDLDKRLGRFKRLGVGDRAKVFGRLGDRLRERLGEFGEKGLRLRLDPEASFGLVDRLRDR